MSRKGPTLTNLREKRNQIRNQLGQPSWTDEELSGLPDQNRRLWDMVEKYTGNPLLVDFLAALIDSYNVPARDPIALARAVQRYSTEHIKYFRERPERFQSPMRSVAWGLGDCDDKAIFIACCLRTFRIPCRLVILRLSLGGKKAGHVYPEAYLDDSWVPLESVRPYPWGHDPALIALERGLLVKRETIGDKPDTTERPEHD